LGGTASAEGLRDPYGELLSSVVSLIEEARIAAVRAVNVVLTSTYWLVGQRIVEHEQSGSYRGVPGGAAALGVHVGMATFFGDATLAPARGHGLQLAMIRHRLQQAAALGCDVASATVLPGSTSHRNYERAGFQPVYARIMLSLALPKG
jgi:GNAT superfamily N-acetyltransferase